MNQRIGFVIAKKLFFHGIPVELAADFAADVDEVTQVHRPVASFDRRDRVFASLDTFEPVLEVRARTATGCGGGASAVSSFGLLLIVPRLISIFWPFSPTNTAPH